MKTCKLYFATNRNHIGADRWKPTGYGTLFSSDGHENLRFGELDLDYDLKKANAHIQHKFKDGRVGDGEKLGVYLAECAKIARIQAYEDLTNKVDAPIEFENNSSTRFFRNLKEHMMNDADVVIYIHGYNVEWEEAVGSALALQMMLNSKKKKDDKDVMVVLFTWPSNGSAMPYAAYKSDRVDARDSGKSIGRGFLKLRDFLAKLHKDAKTENEKLCYGNIHLLCHSMGNYVLENAITSKVLGYAGASRLPRIFDQIFMCAPDVADDVFENGLSRLHEMANFITIYYNNGDFAMNLSKYSKHFDDRLGHTGNARPALIHNKVHQVDCSPIVKGFVEHSYYQWATVNEDIRMSIGGLPFDDPSRKRRRDAQSREWTMV